MFLKNTFLKNKSVILFTNIGLYLSFHNLFFYLFPYILKEKTLFTNEYTNKYNICKKNYIYSLSSFNISLAGLLLFKYKLNTHYYQSFFPHFIFTQGIISYLSDSKYLTHYHWSHDYDISFATYNSFIMLSLIQQNYKLTNFMKISILTGFLCRIIDGYFDKINKVKYFMIAHTLWHTIVPGISIYIVKYAEPIHP